MGMVLRHLQKAYADLQNPLQQEWDLVQHSSPGIREAFHPVEEAPTKIRIS